MKLIIVESPAKARTIEKFLGEGYAVAASYGHIRDLPGTAAEIPASCRDKPWARLGVDTDDGYRPVYVVSSENAKHVAQLKKLLKGADELLLATDEDREGEAISWHVLDVLQPAIPVRRIAFHEITRHAILEALANPRDLHLDLVQAQESRRILDRLFGYTLSPVLWKRVRTKLSAGRVQSAALRLLVELEEARLRFRSAEFWDLEATLIPASGEPFAARLTSVDGQRLAGSKDFDPDTGQLKLPRNRQGDGGARGVLQLDGDMARTLAASAAEALPWRVGNIERKESRRRPKPPLTTSTLQQAASSQLGFTPRRTMQIAQKLYEGVDLGAGEREGLITYMRTDSLTLSEEALRSAAELIRTAYGPDYTQGPRRYKTAAKSAQEAHEAIRPTDLRRSPDTVARWLDKEERALYDLIWRRTLASQMTDAVVDSTAVDLTAKAAGSSLMLRANGSVVRFPGFLKVSGKEDQDTLLPQLETGQFLGRPGDAAVLRSLTPTQHATTPPARFTEASLIKRLEEEGIGRPSTYAPTISTIEQREYAVKRKGALVPTFIGMAVVHLLRKHFDHYVDLKFTARMEEALDGIAAGEVDRADFLDAFYRGSAAEGRGLVRDVDEQLPLIDYPAIDIGAEPGTGEALQVRIGRTYVYVQAGNGEGARRATLPVDLLIDELTPERAADLLAARERADEPIGRDPDSGLNIYVRTGPFGPYLQLGEVVEDQPKPKRVSLGRAADPAAIDLPAALRLLSLPRVVGVCPETGKPVHAGLGRFGPYVERARVFASIDSTEALFTITLEEALQRIQNKNRKPVLKEIGDHPESGAPLQVIQGRYGPYVSDGKHHATLRDGEDPLAVTLEQAVVLIAAAAEKKGRRPAGRARKTTTKKATTKKATTKKATTKKATTKKATTKKATTKKAPTKQTTKKNTTAKKKAPRKAAPPKTSR